VRILIDADGVVADLVSEICTRLLVHGWEYRPEDFKVYPFAEVLSPGAMQKCTETMNEPGFAKTLPVYPGAKECINALKADGHEIVFVTRPFESSPTWAHDRQAWLLETFGHAKVVHTAHKELVKGDILIEDSVENLVSWLEHHPGQDGILVDRPWNKGRYYLSDIRYVGCTLEDIPYLIAGG
jgi:5'(3')-deoxyribonucleotidase